MSKQVTTGLQMAIDKAGGVSALAKLLRTRPSTIQQWLTLDEMPLYKVPDSAVLRAIDAAGGWPALAAALGVTRQAVGEWRRNGWMPPSRAAQCEKLFGIPRFDLVSPKNKALIGGAA